MQARTGLAVAPGERRRAVGEAGDATSVGFIAVIADAAVQTTVDGKRGLLLHVKHNIIRLLSHRNSWPTKEKDASVGEFIC